MEVLTGTWSVIEVRSVIRCFPLKKTSSAEIHHEQVDVYGQNVISGKQVTFWRNEFKKGGTYVRDE